jgi:hypothetical protein
MGEGASRSYNRRAKLVALGAAEMSAEEVLGQVLAFQAIFAFRESPHVPRRPGWDRRGRAKLPVWRDGRRAVGPDGRLLRRDKGAGVGVTFVGAVRHAALCQ